MLNKNKQAENHYKNSAKPTNQLKNKPQNTAKQQFAPQPPANKVSAKRLQMRNGSMLKKIVKGFGQTTNCVRIIIELMFEKMKLSNKLANSKAPP